MSTLSATTPADASKPIDLSRRQVLIIDERDDVVSEVVACCDESGRGYKASRWENTGDSSLENLAEELRAKNVHTVVLSPLRSVRNRNAVDILFAEKVIRACRDASISQLVLISSAEVYGADYSNPGLIREDHSTVLKRPSSIAEG